MKHIKRNPKIEEKLKFWEFLEKSYDGGNSYLEGEYLVQHERESKQGFKRRKEQAMYVNLCAPIVDLYNGYLYQPEHTRDYGSLGSNKLFESFKDNVDYLGHSYTAYIEQLSLRAGVLGFVGVIIDRPADISLNSLQDQIDKDNRAYCVYYEPSQIYDMEFESIDGRMVLIKIILEEESNKKDVERFKIWERDSWVIVEQKKNEEYEQVDNGVNPLGEVPFVMFANNNPLGEAPSSDIKDISYINKRIFNIDSLSMEIIEGSGFPMLEEPYKDEPLDGGDKEVGLGSLLQRGMDDSVGHRWIEPPHSSLGQLLSWRSEYIDNIKMTAKTDSTQSTGQAQSGEALKIRLRALTTVLSNKATSREQAEHNILRLWAKWEDAVFDGTIEYSRKFDVYDMQSEIDTAITAKSVVPSKTYAKVVALNIVDRTTRDLPPETRDAIEKELDAPLPPLM